MWDMGGMSKFLESIHLFLLLSTSIWSSESIPCFMLIIRLHFFIGFIERVLIYPPVFKLFFYLPLGGQNQSLKAEM